MSTTYIDCSAEVSAIQQPAGDRMCWLAADLVTDDYVVKLSDEALAEIESLIGFFADNPLPLMQRKLEEFELPTCRATMAKMKSILDDGVGFAVLDRLPIDDYDVESMLEIYWLLGQC